MSGSVIQTLTCRQRRQLAKKIKNVDASEQQEEMASLLEELEAARIAADQATYAREKAIEEAKDAEVRQQRCGAGLMR